MNTEESRALEMVRWYQDQYRILHDRCNSLTSRVRAAEAEVKALQQKLEEESLTVGSATTEQSSVDHLRDATKMMEELE